MSDGRIKTTKRQAAEVVYKVIEVRWSTWFAWGNRTKWCGAPVLMKASIRSAATKIMREDPTGAFRDIETAHKVWILMGSPK